MARILKIKISRKQENGATHYAYPPEYDPQKIQVLGYETSNDDNMSAVVGRGNDHEFLVGVVKDEDADAFLACKDCEELDEAGAVAFAGNWHKQVEVITDSQAVLKAVSKSVRGEKLTKAETEALDPAHPAPGIGRTRTFAERLSEMMTKM